jgi:hypothetical protein
MSERVLIRREDIEALEDAGYELYRAHKDDLALRLHALALRFRAESGFSSHPRPEESPVLLVLKGGAA